MWVPGALGLAMAAAVFALVRDRPQDCGFPAVERPAAPAAAPPSSGNGRSIRAALATVVREPGVWALAAAYFFVYVVRQGLTSWTVLYLMQAKGAAGAGQASLTFSGLELGGLAGSWAAGAISDAAIKRAAPGAGLVGVRVRVAMAYTALTAAALVLLTLVPPGAQALQWLSVALVGFAIYGPQMLVGLCGAELVSPAAVGPSQGILGLIAYLGAANAGVPLSAVVQRAGWPGFFTALLAACGVTLLLLAPLAGARSYTQRKAAGEI
jgi:sugar phosphate permease